LPHNPQLWALLRVTLYVIHPTNQGEYGNQKTHLQK
jgi:hypothetical protein